MTRGQSEEIIQRLRAQVAQLEDDLRISQGHVLDARGWISALILERDAYRAAFFKLPRCGKCSGVLEVGLTHVCRSTSPAVRA